ncbi:unnamed protein product [Schistosoma turkestanicum]|nr:unnamed protein product [Schistosoma turkestanicum]
MSNLCDLPNLPSGLNNNDLFKTSYGVGHHWRKGFYFPDSDTMNKINKAHRPGLESEHAVKPEDHYQTSYKLVHDLKLPNDYMKCSQYPLPPHHWNVHYINDFRSRFLSGGYRRPLSPSYQTTETKESFCNIDGPSELWRPLSIQPFELENHHKDGPSKNIIASTKSACLSGRPLYPKDKEILRHLDPYLTTYMKDHRIWKPEEIKESKVFSLDPKSIPKEGMKIQKLPMIDTLKFKYPTESTRVRPITRHVPYTGLESIYQSEFKHPNNIFNKMDKQCPVDTPFTLPDPGIAIVHATPNMYKTEYSVIGDYQRSIL